MNQEYFEQPIEEVKFNKAHTEQCNNKINACMHLHFQMCMLATEPAYSIVGYIEYS